MNLTLQNADKGEGGKKSENVADVIIGSSLGRDSACALTLDNCYDGGEHINLLSPVVPLKSGLCEAAKKEND